MMPETGSNDNGHDRDRAIVKVPVQYVYTGDDEDEISLLDLMAALARQKFLVFWITLVFLIGSAAISFFFISPEYKAFATVISNLSQEKVKAVLKGSVVRNVVKEQAALEKAGQVIGLETFGSMMMEKKEDGIIEISVVHPNPQLASVLANAYVDALKTLSREMTLVPAAERRLYYSKELEKVRYNLAKARKEFTALRQDLVPDDVHLQLALRRAELQAQLDADKVHLEGLSRMVSSMDSTSRELILSLLSSTIQELNKRLSKNENELSLLEDRFNSDLLSQDNIVFDERDLAYVEKYSAVKYWESLNTTISDLYELARLEDSLNPAVVQVVSRAVPPQNPFKPNRKLIVILATLLGFFIAVFSAFVAEFARRASQDPEQEEKLRMIKEALNPMTYIRHILRLKKE